MQEEIQRRVDRVLSMLQHQFPGTLSITPGEALVCAGFTSSKEPERAARYAIRQGNYPFPLMHGTGGRRVLLVSIAETLTNALPQSQSERTTSEPPVGSSMLEKGQEVALAKTQESV